MAATYTVTVFVNGSPVGFGRNVFLDGVAYLTNMLGECVISTTAGNHTLYVVPQAGETSCTWSWYEDPTADTGAGVGYNAGVVPSTDAWGTGVQFFIGAVPCPDGDCGGSSPPPPPPPPSPPPYPPPPPAATTCCTALWWCVAGVVTQSEQRPDGATGGPWRSEDEAVANCNGVSPPPPPSPPADVTTACQPSWPCDPVKPKSPLTVKVTWNVSGSAYFGQTFLGVAVWQNPIGGVGMYAAAEGYRITVTIPDEPGGGINSLDGGIPCLNTQFCNVLAHPFDFSGAGSYNWPYSGGFLIALGCPSTNVEDVSYTCSPFHLTLRLGGALFADLEVYE